MYDIKKEWYPWSKRFTLVYSCKSEQQPYLWRWRLLFWFSLFLWFCPILIQVTRILITVTAMLTIPTIVSNIICTEVPFRRFSIGKTSFNGSSQMYIRRKVNRLPVLDTTLCFHHIIFFICIQYNLLIINISFI